MIAAASGTGIAVAAIVTALVVALVTYFVTTRRHPENAASHDDLGVDTSTGFFGGPHDRPAGPGAEDDGVSGRGAPAPGPSASALPQPGPRI